MAVSRHAGGGHAGVFSDGGETAESRGGRSVGSLISRRYCIILTISQVEKLSRIERMEWIIL